MVAWAESTNKVANTERADSMILTRMMVRLLYVVPVEPAAEQEDTVAHSTHMPPAPPPVLHLACKFQHSRLTFMYVCMLKASCLINSHKGTRRANDH